MLLQLVVPPEHDRVHLPPEQTSPTLHPVPQVPQLLGSSWVSTHLLLQLVVPPRHCSEHCPWEQTSPAPTEQGLLQPPQ